MGAAQRVRSGARHEPGSCFGSKAVAAALAASIMLVPTAPSADPASASAAEAADVEAISARALKEMDTHYPAGTAPVRRDAHAKAHGCAKAVFTVDPDLAKDLQVGSFARAGAAFKAWVRFSNGAFHPGPDTGYDGRGMALKIMSVAPDTATHEPVPAHDILMINHPTFFSGDARDYRDFAEAGALTGDQAGLTAYFVPSWNPFGWRIRQAIIAYRIASKTIVSPLAAQYYSMAPFAFGEGRAIKYSAKPCAGQPSLASASRPKGPDFLRDALGSDLAGGSVCYDLMAQEQKEGMPLDDTTAEWSESESPYRRLGAIAFPQQRLDQPGKDAFCENIVFSPWNAPPGQQPLGSINHVRKAVYDAISKYRHARNGAAIPDPAAEWDRF